MAQEELCLREKHMNLVIDNNKGPSGRRRGNGFIYYAQAALVLMGLILTVVTLFVALIGHASWPSLAGVLATLVAYGSILFYAFRGYRETDRRYYLGAVYGVALMLFFKSLAPLHTMLSEALITAAFGLLLVFAERIGNVSQAKKLILAAIIVLVVEAITVMFMPIGVELTSLQNLVVRATPLSSVVLTGTLALVYWYNISLK